MPNVKKTNASAANTDTKKSAGRKSTAKATLKTSLSLEIGENSFSYDDLVKNAKNVYRYDMKKKVSDIKSIDLYVKPEEGKVYFVINGDESGSYNL